MKKAVLAILGMLFPFLLLGGLLLAIGSREGPDVYCDGFQQGVAIAQSRDPRAEAAACDESARTGGPDWKATWCEAMRLGYQQSLEPVAGPPPENWAVTFVENCIAGDAFENFYNL